MITRIPLFDSPLHPRDSDTTTSAWAQVNDLVLLCRELVAPGVARESDPGRGDARVSLGDLVCARP